MNYRNGFMSISLMVFSCMAFAQQGDWNISGSGNKLSGDFYNENIGFSVREYEGGGAGCLKTIDGGQTWSDLMISDLEEDETIWSIVSAGQNSAYIMTYDFVNETAGIGWKSKIYKTENGGQNWESVMTYNSPEYDQNMEGLVKETPGKIWNFSRDGKFRRTTDGGETWQSKLTPYTLFGMIQSQGSFIAAEVTALNFYEEGKGWAALVAREDQAGFYTSSFVLKTENGGNSWDIMPLHDQCEGRINGIYFVDAQKGFVYTESGIYSDHGCYMTTDGGNSWQPVSLEASDFGYDIEINDMAFVSETEGYMIGGRYFCCGHEGNSLIYKTIDGGATWTKEHDEEIWGDIEFIKFAKTPSRLYAFRSNGDLWSRDFGVLSVAQNSQESSTLEVYPNPVINEFVLKGVNKESIELVMVQDVSGKVVKEFANPQDSYDISTLNSGVYIIDVATKNGEHQVHKIQHQH